MNSAPINPRAYSSRESPRQTHSHCKIIFAVVGSVAMLAMLAVGGKSAAHPRVLRPVRPWPVSADSAGSAVAGEFVFRDHFDGAAVRAFRWELVDRAADFAHRAADRYAEDSLATLQEVDDFLR